MQRCITHFFRDIIHDVFLLKKTWSSIHVVPKAASSINTHTDMYKKFPMSGIEFLKLKCRDRQDDCIQTVISNKNSACEIGLICRQMSALCPIKLTIVLKGHISESWNVE